MPIGIKINIPGLLVYVNRGEVGDVNPCLLFDLKPISLTLKSPIFYNNEIIIGCSNLDL